MKRCSKCARVLDLDRFVKSDRYKDGLYPSCKDCRKKVHSKGLAKNPLCSKCGIRPHRPSHRYCYECQRVALGETGPPKWRRDAYNKTMCSRCKVEPRAPGKNYCRDCANAYNKEWRNKKGGHWNTLSEEQKKKATVRHYINQKIQRGLADRMPCCICGKEPSQIHHLNYNDRTMDVIHICFEHHVQLGRLKKKGLTDQDALAYMSDKQSTKPESFDSLDRQASGDTAPTNSA